MDNGNGGNDCSSDVLMLLATTLMLILVSVLYGAPVRLGPLRRWSDTNDSFDSNDDDEPWFTC